MHPHSNLASSLHASVLGIKVRNGYIRDVNIKRSLHESNNDNALHKDPVSEAWKIFRCGIYQMTKIQRTSDWFLQRIGRFTSTSRPSIINMQNIVYFHNTNIKLIRSQCKNMMVITPYTDITFEDDS